MERNTSNSNYDTYFTHDNGGRPFLVKIQHKKNNGGTCYIYKQRIEDLYSDYIEYKDHQNSYSVHIKTYNFIRYFYYDHMYPGNSILLHLDKNRYVFIGQNIYEFDSYGQIIEYDTTVGNNDVPYPYALDDKDYLYLLIENNIIVRNEILKNNADVYFTYYNIKDKKNKKNKLLQVPFKNVKSIHPRVWGPFSSTKL